MKVRHSILAVLALLFSVTLFTACGSDDDDDVNNPAPAATRSYVAIWHYFTVSGDILDYFNVDIIIDNAIDESGKVTTSQVTKRVEKNNLASTGKYEIGQVTSLPGTLTVSRKVTLKDDVNYDNISSMSFVIGHSYAYGYLNSKGDLIDNNKYSGVGTTQRLNATTAEQVQKVVQRVRDGLYDMKPHSYSFDKNGEWVSAYYEEETDGEEAE